jgi:predicted transcriptional regulator
MAALRNFSGQAEPEVLDALQEIAQQEGRQLDAVLADAIREYVNLRRERVNTVEAFTHSLDEYDELYRQLAK